MPIAATRRRPAAGTGGLFISHELSHVHYDGSGTVDMSKFRVPGCPAALAREGSVIIQRGIFHDQRADAAWEKRMAPAFRRALATCRVIEIWPITHIAGPSIAERPIWHPGLKIILVGLAPSSNKARSVEIPYACFS